MRASVLILAVLAFGILASASPLSPAVAGRLPLNPTFTLANCDPADFIDKQGYCVRNCDDAWKGCRSSYANTGEACAEKKAACIKACGC